MKNVIVTGGCGFIGSNWIAKNVHKYRILNIDAMLTGSNPDNLMFHPDDPDDLFQFNVPVEASSHYSFLKEDISKLRPNQINFVPDAILNFAAESHVDRSITDPLSFAQSNVMGTANLLKIACRFPNVRFIHVSTDEVSAIFHWIQKISSKRAPTTTHAVHIQLPRPLPIIS